MISHFSQEPFEGTLHIKDADLQKMAKVLDDVNIKECPYFDLSDKYGNSARYYRENQWIPCSEKLPKTEVLCCDKYGEMIIGYVYEDNTSDTGCSAESETQCMYNCVAWHPLPEPWKEEEE
jgi:hypothetical protein